ncbi:MASE3 domain-containing sensor histidine kinase [Clostridium grantii]|uniref:histidine kinase n=1 Tax=Clostridium grantii DSM 8605 TaxID=1121316 RepID=A0A1M5T0J2_9CLOT|nr:MASE3 domain-containing protein [Clostridium grantii]SHH44307.1 Signal transduction histidine kinase [Clostridium grantii DSM 8605]
MKKVIPKNSLIKKQELSFILVTLIIFWFISQYNFILFHTSLEILVMVSSISLMFIAIGTWNISKNKMFSYIGILYGFIGILNFSDIVSYAGIVTYSDAINKAYQTWAFASSYQSISLCIAVYFINSNIKLNKLIYINFSIIIIGMASIYLIPIFPTSYTAETGITLFKYIDEAIVIGVYILSIYLYKKNSNEFPLNTCNLVIVSVILTIISELCFIFSTSLFDSMNFLAHISKGISFYLLYKGLFLVIIIDPYETIFNKLNKKAEDLKKANIIIAKEAKKYSEILDFLPTGIVKKENNKIVYANKIAKEIFNIHGDIQLLEEYFSFANFDEIKLNIGSVSNQTEKYFTNTKENIFWVDNKKVITEISTLSINEENTNSIFLVIKDIGYKEKAQEMLKILKEKEKSEKLKDEFFANISHELKTPITVIHSAIQTEKIFLQNKDIESLKKYNGIIKQNCNRLIRIINNIIDSTKIESGFMNPILKVNNIVELIENITQSIVHYVKSKEMEVVFDTCEEEIYILCDPDYIERIILNLLSNAIKYSQKGSTIQVIINKDDLGQVLIMVKDNGIGISPDNIDSIFDRFEKVDKKMNRENEGSGIGLFITKSLVEIQKGTILVESELTKGSNFFIKFPVLDDYDESCISTETSTHIQDNNIVEKINIEFSDIYF